MSLSPKTSQNLHAVYKKPDFSGCSLHLDLRKQPEMCSGHLQEENYGGPENSLGGGSKTISGPWTRSYKYHNLKDVIPDKAVASSPKKTCGARRPRHISQVSRTSNIS